MSASSSENFSRHALRVVSNTTSVIIISNQFRPCDLVRKLLAMRNNHEAVYTTGQGIEVKCLCSSAKNVCSAFRFLFACRAFSPLPLYKRAINKVRAGWSLRLGHLKETISSQSRQTHSVKLVSHRPCSCPGCQLLFR